MMHRSAKANLQYIEFQPMSNSIQEIAEIAAASQHNTAPNEQVTPREPLQAARVRRR